MRNLRQFFPIAVLSIALVSLVGAVSVERPAAGQEPPGEGAAAMNRTVEVVSGIDLLVPASWNVLDKSRNALELTLPSQDRKGSLDAHALITAEVRRSHAEALKRLSEIAAEDHTSPTFLQVAGWPAIERRRVAPLPLPGASAEGSAPAPPEKSEKGAVGAQPPPGQPSVSHPRAHVPAIKSVEAGESLRVTTAIAAGANLLRIETTLSPKADPKVADLAVQLARQVHFSEAADPAQTQRDLEQLATPASRAPSAFAPLSFPPAQPSIAVPSTRAAKPRHGGKGPRPGSVVVRAGEGELEIAVSKDGQHVVVALNTGYSWSDNGGATFTAQKSPCTLPPCDGDPSLTVGKSGAFYFSWIGTTATKNDTDGLSVSSSDHWQTFNFRSKVVVCKPPICSLPDQEHIDADRFNASGSGQDQVYMVWRNFAADGPGETPKIVCSKDGGASWEAQQVIASGDFPRISIGQDGSVYVVYVNPSYTYVMLNKYSSCAKGLAQHLDFPVAVAPYNQVVCPVPGLDRCNQSEGNVLSSPTVAVDDLDLNHVYIAFANSTSSNNENILVMDSTDGGATWPRSVQVNRAVPARRFMPWLSTYRGVAYVGWYDRRLSNNEHNDWTRYYGGNARVHGGKLVAGPEADISQKNDPECGPANTPWCWTASSAPDATSCSVQPQLAGVCNGDDPEGNCDFKVGGECSAAECLSGEALQTTGGCPKYGDYNGFVARAGRLYYVWSSATPPPGVKAPGLGINIYAHIVPAPSKF